ncbi:MAG: hypothetical protein COW72_00210 [Candidatus Nealsonbacteria bacterium CG18_big_fil_WC_8_21_14_2_50_37_10]|uniref:Uncharacterized protein n=2 Tax=Parcubacteria group TaxID=1794811 RepID=A0A2H0FL77_9BACT|nr:MAG: hypothetical protein COW72_00210 [Candidatus Nealsonbacteria bacterium CG18_big_fil_WC_8_21_14_2_50_37_10]PJB84002.1 MAG: hypothetical protein CO087_00735 [Candidatus Wolfebacteria bacterium CG_4_9_14_0_8_um_filter_39_46]
MANSKSWEKIFNDHKILEHDFSKIPFPISATQIKRSCQKFKETGEKEVRILCKQDSREDRPEIFKKHNLFLLPVKNGFYNIIKGEGYVDIPPIKKEITIYSSKLDFPLDTAVVGDSEMQHLDFAYATSLIRTFTEDPSLVLTIRGRKYTPDFDFYVGKQLIKVSSVQTEVDAGYEGKNQIVLIEAKNFKASDVIIRQLFYPYRQWQSRTKKKVVTLFFDKEIGRDVYSIWQFEFEDIKNYNSIKLVKSGRFTIK